MGLMWRYHLIDLETGREERRLSGAFKMSREFNGQATATLSAREGEAPDVSTLGHGLLAQRWSPDLPPENPWVDMFSGICVGLSDTGKDVGPTQTQLSFVDASWLARNKRFADLENGEGYTEEGVQVGEAPTDKISLLGRMLARANARGNTRLRMHPQQGSAQLMVPITDWGVSLLGKAWDDLAQMGPNFQWRCVPTLRTDEGGLVLGDIQCAPVLGRDRRESRFAFRTGAHNCTDASYEESAEEYANEWWSFAPGEEQFSLPGYPPNFAEANRRFGLLQGMAGGDYTDPGLRRAWLAAVILAKGLAPKGVLSITPKRSDGTGRDTDPVTGDPLVDVPIPGIHYDVYDRIHVEAILHSGRLISGPQRVYRWSVSVEEDGSEQAEIGLLVES